MTGLLIGMQKSLFNFAYSLTMNRDDAQDLLQATSLKVLSNVEKLVHYENLNGWMYTTCVIFLLMIITVTSIAERFMIMKTKQ